VQCTLRLVAGLGILPIFPRHPSRSPQNRVKTDVEPRLLPFRAELKWLARGKRSLEDQRSDEGVDADDVTLGPQCLKPWLSLSGELVSDVRAFVHAGATLQRRRVLACEADQVSEIAC
jgi:hypothetical protein